MSEAVDNIPNDIKEKIEQKAKSYYKAASIGNKFKTMHELGFNRGAEYAYQLAQDELIKKDERIKDLETTLRKAYILIQGMENSSTTK